MRDRGKERRKREIDVNGTQGMRRETRLRLTRFAEDAVNC